MTRVLVVAYDAVGPRMAGPGIRARALSQALATEHEVVLACRHEPSSSADGFRLVHAPDPATLNDLVAECEVVIGSGPFLQECPAALETGRVIVADVYAPFTIDDLQLRMADLFLAACERQRDLVTGMLAAVDRVDDLVTVVPFGVPNHDPVPGRPVLRGVRPGFAADDLILLWAGGIHDALDPLTLIDGIALLGAEDVKLLFMGTTDPNPDAPATVMADRALKRAEERNVKDTLVFFNEGWVPYDDRVNYLLEADVGVSTHYRRPEAVYSVRARMLDFVWTGLPVLCTEGDGAAGLVAGRDLGEVVPPEDPAAIAAAIDRLLDLDRRERCSANLLALADELRWETVAAPLVAFCREPRASANRIESPVVAVSIAPASADVEHLEEERQGFEATIAEQRGELDRVRTEHAAALSQLDEVTREVAQLRAELDELERLREDHAAAAAQLAEARGEAADVREELDRLRAEHAEAVSQLDELERSREAVTTAASELEDARGETADLREELERLRAEHAEAVSQLDELARVRDERDHLLPQLEELDRLRREHDALVRQIDELSAFREKTLNSLPYRAARWVRDRS